MYRNFFFDKFAMHFSKRNIFCPIFNTIMFRPPNCYIPSELSRRDLSISIIKGGFHFRGNKRRRGPVWRSDQISADFLFCFFGKQFGINLADVVTVTLVSKHGIFQPSYGSILVFLCGRMLMLL